MSWNGKGNNQWVAWNTGSVPNSSTQNTSVNDKANSNNGGQNSNNTWNNWNGNWNNGNNNQQNAWVNWNNSGNSWQKNGGWQKPSTQNEDTYNSLSNSNSKRYVIQVGGASQKELQKNGENQFAGRGITELPQIGESRAAGISKIVDRQTDGISKLITGINRPMDGTNRQTD